MSDPRFIEGERGRYLVLGQVASGAMGRIHLAHRYARSGEALGEAAIKQIRPELLEDRSIRQMFEDEGRLSVQLVHPNIVHTFEAGFVGSEPFLAMELVSGVTLQALAQRLLGEGRALPVRLVIEVVQQILAGLGHAHQRRDAQGELLGVVHRDVSPQNLMIGFNGAVKLFDFGVGLSKGRTHKTNPGFVKGRLAYMSPEQVGNAPVDARSDLFSVGVLAYEALVLVHPFYGKTDAMLMRAVREQPAPDPRSVDPGFPPALAEILLRALEKDPERRYQTAEAFSEALERFVSGWRFPPGPDLGELVREAYSGRVALESRARSDGDDELLVRAMREDLEPEAPPEPSRSAPRGEALFADLPTAEVELAAPEEGPFPKFSQAAELWRLLDAMPTPMFASRVANGEVVYVNQRALELFGARAGDALFSSDYYVNPSDRSRLLARVEKEASERAFVLEMKRRGGERFWASVTARIIDWDDDRLLIGSLSDISDRIEVESRLARRLVHQRRLAQAAAALLRTRDGDPADTGLLEALEHLRAGTESDRVVLMQVQDHPQRGPGLLRGHAAGLELGELRWVSMAAVPRWRALFERGEALRGAREVFPEAERELLERLGIGAILAAPVSRKGSWLGVLTLEASEGRRAHWSDEDVTSLETLAGVLAGELARRRERSRTGVEQNGATAGLQSGASRLRDRLPELRRALEGWSEPDSRALVVDALEGFSATVGEPLDAAGSLELGVRLQAEQGFEAVTVEGVGRHRVPRPIARAILEAIDELRGGGVYLTLRPGLTEGLRFSARITRRTGQIWSALSGDATALTCPGSRIGGLLGLRQRFDLPMRLTEGDEGLVIEIDLPETSEA